MVSITETARVHTAPVQLDYKLSDTVKHTFTALEDSKTQQFHFPLCNAENSQSLTHAWSFLTAAKRIDFDSESGVWYCWTGTLREGAKAIWDVIDEVFPAGTDMDFNQLQLQIHAWIGAYADNSDRAQQSEYIRSVKKPVNMECRAFLIKLRNLSAMAKM
jgi:hypothetical protein